MQQHQELDQELWMVFAHFFDLIWAWSQQGLWSLTSFA